MNYSTDLERETQLDQLSIANAELCNVLALIEESRNNEVEFYRLIRYAKQLQSGLLKLEWELKNRIRNL